MPTAEGLTIPFYQPDDPEHGVRPGMLETFPESLPESLEDYATWYKTNAHPPQVIETVTEEFQAVCPFSGLPDQGTLTIRYIPDGKIIELKSLKYYVMSYRNVGIYQEHAASLIFKHLWEALRSTDSYDHLYIELIYKTRGGFVTTCKIGNDPDSTEK